MPTIDEEEDNVPLTVAHQVDHEAEAEVGTVFRPAGEVGGATSPHDQDEDRILVVQVHVWIDQGQGHGRIPIPEVDHNLVPEVPNHLLGSRGRLLDLPRGALVQQDQNLVPEPGVPKQGSPIPVPGVKVVHPQLSRTKFNLKNSKKSMPTCVHIKLCDASLMFKF